MKILFVIGGVIIAGVLCGMLGAELNNRLNDYLAGCNASHPSVFRWQEKPDTPQSVIFVWRVCDNWSPRQ